MQVRFIILFSLFLINPISAQRLSLPRIDLKAVNEHKRRIEFEMKKKQVIKGCLLGAGGVIALVCLYDLLHPTKKVTETITLPEQLANATNLDKFLWLTPALLQGIHKDTQQLIQNTDTIPESEGWEYVKEWVVDWKNIKESFQIVVMLYATNYFAPKALKICGFHEEAQGQCGESIWDSIHIYGDRNLKLPLTLTTLAYYACKLDENHNNGTPAFLDICGRLNAKIEHLMGYISYTISLRAKEQVFAKDAQDIASHIIEE